MNKKTKDKMKDNSGKYRTRTLFAELNNNKAYKPLYTMSDSEKDGLPSARSIFIACDTEYEAVMMLVGSMEHWNKLLKVKDFVDGIEGTSWEGLSAWRIEQVKRKISDQMTVLTSLANDGNVAASKTIMIEANKELETLIPTGKNKEKEPEIVEDDDVDESHLKLLKDNK